MSYFLISIILFFIGLIITQCIETNHNNIKKNNLNYCHKFPTLKALSGMFIIFISLLILIYGIFDNFHNKKVNNEVFDNNVKKELFNLNLIK